ncbi:hypothetical protein ACNO5E_17960 [Vibrio parahaemolyticus]
MSDHNEYNEQAVTEVEKIIRDAIASSPIKEQISAVAKKYEQNLSAVLIQSLSIFSLKIASAAEKDGMLMATFIGGDGHFACIGKNDMLVSDIDKLREGGQVLLGQVGHALGFTKVMDMEDQEKAEQEPSINEKLVQEVLEEEAEKATH